MSGHEPLTQEQRDAEEQALMALAQGLRDLATSTAAEGHTETINGFADEAEKYAKMIREAVSPELAAAFVAKANKKAAGWAELAQMLQIAQLVEGPDGEENAKALQDAIVEEAGEKLKATAEALRNVSGTGNSPVFQAIGDIAAQAEAGLQEFLDAETQEEKLEIYARVEENRAQWLERMTALQESVRDDGNDSTAPTDAPGDRDSELEEFHDAMEDPFEKAFAAMNTMGAFSSDSNFGRGGGSRAAAAPTIRPKAAAAPPPAAPAAPAQKPPPVVSSVSVPPTTASPEDARGELVKYLNDGEDSYLKVLRKMVDKVKADARFEGVHEDAEKFATEMEAAASAVLGATPAAASGSLADAEEALTSTVEPMRRAQAGALEAKKLAFNIQKYDIYKRKGAMPKLGEEYPDLLECAKFGIDISNMLRKQAQNNLLDSVAGLVASTGVGSP